MQRGFDYNQTVKIEAEKLSWLDDNCIIMLSLCELLGVIEGLKDSPYTTALTQELERRGEGKPRIIHDIVVSNHFDAMNIDADILKYQITKAIASV